MVLHIIVFHVDEFYFHRKRKLCRNEVLGIFADGGFYLIPLIVAIFAPVTELWKTIYIIMATLSIISVIKNEWFYGEDITREERLVHAALYVLHPVLLFTFYHSWTENYFVHNLNFWIVQIVYLGFGTKTLIHQIIYWNYLRTDCQ